MPGCIKGRLLESLNVSHTFFKNLPDMSSCSFADSFPEREYAIYTGVADFFYGQNCITGFSRAQLDDALSPLEFSIPDINGKVTQVGLRVYSVRLR